LATSTEVCLRCQTPLVDGAPYCHACGVAQTAAATGEFEAFDLDRFFTYAVDLLCIAGTDGYFKRINPAFQRTLGFTAQELQARPFAEFIHPDDRSDTVAEVGKLATGQPTLSFENRFRCKDGTYRHLQWTSYPEAVTGLLYAVARDVTEAHRAQGQTDALTGLASDDTFEFRLAQEWNRTRRLKVPLALGILDLDRFRQFNDRHGYQAGDQVLGKIGATLRRRLRRVSDLAARVGGQRVALLLSGSSSAEATALCEAVREEVVAGSAGAVTVSGGVVAVVPDGTRTHEQLVEAAERALRRAKDQGRNLIVSEA
jgi:diguanylate cyclase (GGDEF)-like protein/PAS domain S-box-containing protein